MPRSIGYNVIGWNEAPWARSGYYTASDAISPTFDITAAVGDSQSASFDVTHQVGDSQAASFDIRQFAADSQVAEFDVTTPVADSQSAIYDMAALSPAALLRCRYGIAMPALPGNAALNRVPAHGTLTRRRAGAALTQINP